MDFLAPEGKREITNSDQLVVLKSVTEVPENKHDSFQLGTMPGSKNAGEEILLSHENEDYLPKGYEPVSGILQKWKLLPISLFFIKYVSKKVELFWKSLK